MVAYALRLLSLPRYGSLRVGQAAADCLFSLLSENMSSRRINELRVSDLKNELEKRGLDVSGLKPELLDRLMAAILDEGLDPANLTFPVPDDTSAASSVNVQDAEENSPPSLQSPPTGNVFSLASWCSAASLSQSTQLELNANGYTSREALAALTSEDLKELKFENLAQKSLLRRAVLLLASDDSARPSTVPSTPSIPTPAASQVPAHNVVADALRQVEQLMTATKTGSTAQSAQVTGELPRPHSFIYSKDASKLRPTDLDFSSFVYGAVCCLDDMIQGPQSTDRRLVKEYSAYLKFVFDKATRFNARSVIVFDDHFRDHIARRHLAFNDSQTWYDLSAQHFDASAAKKLASQASKGKPICNRWNFSVCRPPCNYRHVCAQCFQATHTASKCERRTADSASTSRQ